MAPSWMANSLKIGPNISSRLDVQELDDTVLDGEGLEELDSESDTHLVLLLSEDS